MQEQQKNTQKIDFDDIITPDDFVKLYPDKFTQPQITWLLRNRVKNGLQQAGAVSYVNRRFYIIKQRFLEWLTQKS